jgi:hypothetical protein
MRWARHVAFMEMKNNAYRYVRKRRKEINHQDDLGVDGRKLKNGF